MSLTLLLWFLSTLLALWGATLFIRGLRGERVRLRTTPTNPDNEPVRQAHQRPPWRPTWVLVLAGLVVCAGGLALGWWSIGIGNELAPRGRGDVTPWHAIAAGIGVFGVMLGAYGLFGDRSRGRQRCPRCWYDQTDQSIQTLPTTCAECGREITAAKELHRTRRHRKVAGLGVAVLVLAGGVLLVMARPGGPASVLPSRMLVWYAFQGRASATWVRGEIDRRIDADDPSISAPLARRWIDRTLAGDVEVARTRTPLVSRALFSRPDRATKARFTQDQLRRAWTAHFTQLTDLLINADPSVRQWVWTYAPDYNLILMTLGADADGTADPDDLRLTPATRFGLPDLSEDKRNELSHAFIDDPSYTRAVAYLFGPESHAVFRDELLQTPSKFAPDGRAFQEAARIALGFSAALYPEAMQDAIDMLANENPNVRLFGARALHQATHYTVNPISPDQIDAIRMGLDDNDATVRERCWLSLLNLKAVTVPDFVRLSRRPDLTDQEIGLLFVTNNESLADVSPDDLLALANSVLSSSSSTARLDALVRYLSRERADDPDIIPILRRIAQSPDPMVAEQARTMLQRLNAETEPTDD